MGRNEKLITSERGVAVCPIAGCRGGSERGCQLRARAAHVKVLKGLCRVGTREQRCAAEEPEIPSQNSPGRLFCTLYLWWRATRTVRAEARAGARVRVQVPVWLQWHVSHLLLSLENRGYF